MGDFQKHTAIRLINKVLGHEIGHFVANILLNSIQSEPVTKEIILRWDKSQNVPAGQIEYSIKEGPRHWVFPKDFDLCCFTVLSLLSGCIWENFINSIFFKRQISTQEVQNCYKLTGRQDYIDLNFINRKFL